MTDLGPTTNHFRYYLFCLQGSRAEDFLARDQPLGWALAALMRPETLSRAEHKMACLRRIAAAPLDELRRFLLVNWSKPTYNLLLRSHQPFCQGPPELRFSRDLAPLPSSRPLTEHPELSPDSHRGKYRIRTR